MKIQLLSDLPLEFAKFERPEVTAEVVVLAGDIHLGTRGLQWAKRAVKDKPVIYVLGNHEHYGQALPRITEKLRAEAENTSVPVLEKDKVILDDVVFLGCTLWTDFKLPGDPQIAAYRASQRMNDYRKIRVSPRYRRLKPIDTLEIHRKSIAWLKDELNQAQGKKTVVVTHQALSMRSLSPISASDEVGAAYASHLDTEVEPSGAALWIHGHIHERCDYRIGETRVLCHPRGYPDEANEHFDPSWMVEI